MHPDEELAGSTFQSKFQSGNALTRIRLQKESMRESHRRFLARLQKSGISEEAFIEARSKSLNHNSNVEDILIAEGSLQEDDYFQSVADDLDLTFTTKIDSNLIMADIGWPGAAPGKAAQVFARSQAGTTILYLAPDRNSELLARNLIEEFPEQRRRFRITTRKAIRDALDQHSSGKLAEQAANSLFHTHPAFSAKQTFMPWQSFLTGLLVVLLPYSLITSPGMTLACMHILASVIFLFGVYQRICAVPVVRTQQGPLFFQGREYPLYTVMVALHREAAVALQLVKAMSALDWPPERMEVIYICESDDAETIDALGKAGMPHNQRIIIVPAGLPRTKPKALNFGLGRASGDYVVIYDAEDRPHPAQLKEAFQTFKTAPESLACLQAPLNITNGGSSWFSNFFAFEYRAHFFGLLPYLAAKKLPLPLGGTSNHFKREILVKAGGWDPYNVTEDADLGIRLARLGYQTDVLKSPTLEDGPETIREWLPQRIRWQKGWMQTALVHSRNVAEFFGSAGTREATFTSGLIGGFILAPLLYPLGIASFIYAMTRYELGYSWLAAADIMIFLFGFLAYGLLGFACDEGKPWYKWAAIILGMPFYWLWISAASWLALAQLVLKPHHWNKTPHRPTRV